MARTVSGRFFSAGVGVWDFVHFQVCSKFHGGTSDHVEQEVLGGSQSSSLKVWKFEQNRRSR